MEYYIGNCLFGVQGNWNQNLNFAQQNSPREYILFQTPFPSVGMRAWSTYIDVQLVDMWTARICSDKPQANWLRWAVFLKLQTRRYFCLWTRWTSRNLFAAFSVRAAIKRGLSESIAGRQIERQYTTARVQPAKKPRNSARSGRKLHTEKRRKDKAPEIAATHLADKKCRNFYRHAAVVGTLRYIKRGRHTPMT
jgi:hypothetical protein